MTDTLEKRVSDLERQLAALSLTLLMKIDDLEVRLKELEERARALAPNANRC